MIRCQVEGESDVGNGSRVVLGTVLRFAVLRFAVIRFQNSHPHLLAFIPRGNEGSRSCLVPVSTSPGLISTGPGLIFPGPGPESEEKAHP